MRNERSIGPLVGAGSALALCASLLVGCACGGSTVRKLQTGESCNPAEPGTDQCIGDVCLTFDNKSGMCTTTCAEDKNCYQGFSCEDTSAGRVCVRKTGCKEDTDCPSGHVCDTEASRCYVRVVRGLCSPCTSSLQCPAGGGCFTTPGSGERFCSTVCNAGACPFGFVCRELDFGAAKLMQCTPSSGTCNAGRPLCAACKGDEECGGFADLCVRNLVSGEQFCGTVCTLGSLRTCADGSGCPSGESCLSRAEVAGGQKRCFVPIEDTRCPTGFTCVDLSGQAKGPFQCVPNGNTCKGYCDSSDERVQTLQCGLGRMCDVGANRCVPAADGRECAPCFDNDNCRKSGHPDNQCLVNTCADCPQKGETFCAEPCPATGGDAECYNRFGPGFTCAPAGTQSFCVPRRGTCLSGLGRLGDTCAANGPADCVTGLCLRYGSAALCTGVCASDSACGDTRYRCCDLAGGFYDCGAAGRNAADNGPKSGSGVCAPMGGQFGDDCSPGRPPCQGGTCLDIGTARLCTDTCESGGCPQGFACREAVPVGGGNSVKVCFPDGGGLPGSDCTFGPAACADRLCVRKESGDICTKPCTSTVDCPTSWKCQQAETVDRKQVQVCLPAGLT